MRRGIPRGIPRVVAGLVVAVIATSLTGAAASAGTASPTTPAVAKKPPPEKGKQLRCDTKGRPPKKAVGDGRAVHKQQVRLARFVGSGEPNRSGSVPRGRICVVEGGIPDELVKELAAILGVPVARVEKALGGLLKDGQVDVSSAKFAAAAKALGVTPRELDNAFVQAKRALADKNGGGEKPPSTKPGNPKPKG